MFNQLASGQNVVNLAILFCSIDLAESDPESHLEVLIDRDSVVKDVELLAEAYTFANFIDLSLDRLVVDEGISATHV